jgi:hypothetical protein
MTRDYVGEALASRSVVQLKPKGSLPELASAKASSYKMRGITWFWPGRSQTKARG